jgi:hypothetical protein
VVRQPVTKEVPVPPFPYGAPAEVFAASSIRRSSRMNYRRFDTAAEAIRYVIEDLPAPMHPGISIQVGDERLGFGKIAALYEAVAYPLRRRDGNLDQREGNTERGS